MTKKDLLKMTYEVYRPCGGYQAVQVASPEDILLLEPRSLDITTETLEVLLRELDLDPEEEAAVKKTLELVQYLNTTELTLCDLL